MTYETMQKTTSASRREVNRAIRVITTQWKLFEWSDEQDAYVRLLRPMETPQSYRDRTRRSVRIPVGVAWILRDIVETARGGEVSVRGLAPHTNGQFAEQLNCHPLTVARALGEVLALGYFRRYNPRHKPLYAHPDDPSAILYEEKYMEDERSFGARNVNVVRFNR